MQAFPFKRVNSGEKIVSEFKFQHCKPLGTVNVSGWGVQAELEGWRM